MSGVDLGHGCRITHGSSAVVRTPFPDMPLTMHELSAGGGITFSGPYGFIPFTTNVRLPRHVHLSAPDGSGVRWLLAERILVLNGCGLVELAGALHVVAPGSLVDIGPGVPHTWTACPPGLRLPDESEADGTFLMVYEYEAQTGFSPTAATLPLADAAAYEAFEELDYEPIRIPRLAAADLGAHTTLVWHERAIRPET